jgi:hypothetical protein
MIPRIVQPADRRSGATSGPMPLNASSRATAFEKSNSRHCRTDLTMRRALSTAADGARSRIDGDHVRRENVVRVDFPAVAGTVGSISKGINSTLIPFSVEGIADEPPLSSLLRKLSSLPCKRWNSNLSNVECLASAIHVSESKRGRKWQRPCWRCPASDQAKGRK